MQAAQPAVVVRSYSSGTFGRCIAHAGNHHFVVDDTVPHRGPGEQPSPTEIFLTGVTSCGVLMMGREAESRGIPLERIEVTAEAVRSPSPGPQGVTTFERLTMRAVLQGPSEAQARELVAFYQQNCPLYGSVAASAADVRVDFVVAAAV
jgi:uncharacterized OsmC-like protein